MTKDDEMIFFYKVRGKRIRCIVWPERIYFVPTQLLTNGMLFGDCFNWYPLGSSEVKKAFFSIGNGFTAPDPTWEWAEDSSIKPNATIGDGQSRAARPQQELCNCEMRSLMMYGCKCGGE